MSVRDLVAAYEPDLPILRGVSFTVHPGELVALLGPNGAGKSTLVKAIAGTAPILSGTVQLSDVPIEALPVHEKLARGLGFVPQTENVFTSLSVGENLQLAADRLPKSERQKQIAQVEARFPDLIKHRHHRAGALSGGQRQMLAIGRALIGAPSVLMLDEPSAGLSPRVVGEVFAALQTLNRAGVTIVLVEQNVRAALAIASRALILVEGRIAHEGVPSALLGDDTVADLYLGRKGHVSA
nr:ABC transporter ATP-binding protein [Mesorhizobium liriopis]